MAAMTTINDDETNSELHMWNQFSGHDNQKIQNTIENKACYYNTIND